MRRQLAIVATITAAAATTMLGQVPSANAYVKNGCKFSSNSISYIRSAPGGTISFQQTANYTKAVTNAASQWNSRVKPQFFYSTSSTVKKSLTFHYSHYGNNGLYAWVVRTANCNFWDGP